MNKKFIITEEEKKEIKKIYNLSEEDDNIFKFLLRSFLKNIGLESFFNSFSDYDKQDLTKTVKTSANFEDIVAEVIDELEGGYYHPDMLRDGRIRDSRYGNSGETMMGIDRKAGGKINNTPEGIKFWQLIDNANARRNWKWNYRGGNLENELRRLAGLMIKRYYDDYSNRWLSDKTKKIVNSNRKLLFNFIYAVWNGPGWFKKFAKIINDAVDSGIKNGDILAELFIKSRIQSGNSLIAQGGRKIAKILNIPTT